MRRTDFREWFLQSLKHGGALGDKLQTGNWALVRPPIVSRGGSRTLGQMVSRPRPPEANNGGGDKEPAGPPPPPENNSSGSSGAKPDNNTAPILMDHDTARSKLGNLLTSLGVDMVQQMSLRLTSNLVYNLATYKEEKKIFDSLFGDNNVQNQLVAGGMAEYINENAFTFNVEGILITQYMINYFNNLANFVHKHLGSKPILENIFKEFGMRVYNLLRSISEKLTVNVAIDDSLVYPEPTANMRKVFGNLKPLQF